MRARPSAETRRPDHQKKKNQPFQAGATTIADTPEWKALQEHVAEIEQT